MFDNAYVELNFKEIVLWSSKGIMDLKPQVSRKLAFRFSKVIETN